MGSCKMSAIELQIVVAMTSIFGKQDLIKSLNWCEIGCPRQVKVRVHN